MPPNNNLCNGILIFLFLTTACAGYAYYVNARRPADDPQKRNYPPIAILFAPVTVPILLLFAISIFILRVLVYGLFLILFVIALVLIRKPFLLSILHKTAMYIGNKLLQANTILIKLLLRPWTNKPGTI